MKSLLSIFICAMLAVLPASAQDSNASVADGNYPLTQGQSATLGQDVSLTLDSVSDSRCPSGALCAASGKLAYHFTLRARGSTESFTLSTDAPTYRPGKLPGVSLALDGGDPPSAAREGDPKPTFNVTVQVTNRR
jgi:hypothetical protein